MQRQDMIKGEKTPHDITHTHIHAHTYTHTKHDIICMFLTKWTLIIQRKVDDYIVGKASPGLGGNKSNITRNLSFCLFETPLAKHADT